MVSLWLPKQSGKIFIRKSYSRNIILTIDNPNINRKKGVSVFQKRKSKLTVKYCIKVDKYKKNDKEDKRKTRLARFYSTYKLDYKSFVGTTIKTTNQKTK